MNGKPSREEAGFTLVETLIAIVILVIGLMAITNLFIVAGSSNLVARQMTASTAQASEAMEALKVSSFRQLPAVTTGQFRGAVDAAALQTDATDIPADQPLSFDANSDGTVDRFGVDRQVPGVGEIRIRWQIVAVDNITRLVRVVAAPQSPLLSARGRADLVSYRTCTSPALGCPQTP